MVDFNETKKTPTINFSNTINYTVKKKKNKE